MKKFICGFLTATVLMIAFVAAAATYTAETADFKILVNGSEWTTDKPIVTIGGSTYLPLRALGEALNVNVNWNEVLRQVEIGGSKEQTSSEPEQLNQGKLTLEKYYKIENGMTYEEVVNIIGFEVPPRSETGEKGTEYYTVAYIYDEENAFGDMGANAYFLFRNSKLVMKSQAWLK